jgi:hypothetical protein
MEHKGTSEVPNRTPELSSTLSKTAHIQAVVDAVRASAETLSATLEHTKVVEEMRRTLREIRT